MMFVDASAVVGILGLEGDAEDLSAKLEKAETIWISSFVHYEAVLGLARASSLPLERARQALDDFIAVTSARFVPLDEAIGRRSIEAYSRYGKSRHRARLNVGDCFAYACAKELAVPLLCKGDDFVHTDVEIA